MKAILLKKHHRKFKSGALQDLIVHTLLGAAALAALVFFMITGFSYLKNMIIHPMQNPDFVDPSVEEIPVGNGDTPDNLLELTPGTVIYTGAVNTLAKLDFPQFKSAADIPDEYLIAFGLWQAVLSDQYADKITYNNENVTIPAEVVLNAAKEYFDFDRELAYQDNHLLGDFTYSARTNSFTTAIYGIESVYLPRVKAVMEVDNHITLKLEYISADEQRSLEETGGAGTPDAQKAVTVKVIPNEESGFKILELQPDIK